MFGGKKAPHYAEQDSRNAHYAQAYEYRVLVGIGAMAFEKDLNKHAANGWELVSGMMAGTAHYGYLRRALIQS